MVFPLLLFVVRLWGLFVTLNLFKDIKVLIINTTLVETQWIGAPHYIGRKIPKFIPESLLVLKQE